MWRRVFEKDRHRHSKSGRTDKAVHAIGQVFHFESDKSVPVNNLKKATNEMLPLSIRINSCEIVSDDFHARYQAVKKTYQYIINLNEFNPLDKAGSYGIQELPDGILDKYEGSFENIVGLAPEAVTAMLKEFGY